MKFPRKTYTVTDIYNLYSNLFVTDVLINFKHWPHIFHQNQICKPHTWYMIFNTNIIHTNESGKWVLVNTFWLKIQQIQWKKSPYVCFQIPHDNQITDTCSCFIDRITSNLLTTCKTMKKKLWKKLKYICDYWLNAG